METKRIVQTEETERYCDECGLPASHQCHFCFKDLCGWMQNKHAISDPYDDGGDYPNYYCKECLEDGKPFMEIIDKAREKKSKAFKDWEEACKKRRKEVKARHCSGVLPTIL